MLLSIPLLINYIILTRGMFWCCIKKPQEDDDENAQEPKIQQKIKAPSKIQPSSNRPLKTNIDIQKQAQSSSFNETNYKNNDRIKVIELTPHFNSRNQEIQGQRKQQRKYNINLGNLDDLIREVSGSENKESAYSLFSQISTFISQTNDKSFPMMEKLAYVEASLAECCPPTGKTDCQKHEARAFAIYAQFEGEYFQEMITLLNNAALRNERDGEFQEAVKKYWQVLEMQKRYYNIGDERKLLSLNNLACAYCEGGVKAQQGLHIFQDLLKVIKEHQVSNEIASLIRQNHNFYKKMQKR